MNERERLIKELKDLRCPETHYFTLGMPWQVEQIANFILTDRLRILEEIAKVLKEQHDAPGKGCQCYAYYSGECACDADWTDTDTKRVKKALKSIIRLKK